MPAIRFTATLSAAERDSLYLANLPAVVIRYEAYFTSKRRRPPLAWFRRQLILTESIPDCVRWEYDVDHIFPRSMGGQNEPENLIIIPSTMNRGFNRYIDRDKIAFLGKTIFDSAKEAMKANIVDTKTTFNPFGEYVYNKSR